MKISIVNGFFLPVPPLAGGSTEKTWYRLAQAFAARGHEVCSISRTWPGQAEDELQHGIRHRRLPGWNHSRFLPLNLWRDWNWSRRVTRALPPADIVVVNAVSLPWWLARRRPDAGRIVIMTGRVPKGQYRLYRDVALVIAASRPVLEQVARENPALARVARVRGYPIDHRLLSETAPAPELAVDPSIVTLGFVGRVHREKGLGLLLGALGRLARESDLPPWRLVVCGPVDIARGGSGAAYLEQELQRAKEAGIRDRVTVVPPRFDPSALAGVYRSIDVFCLPSLAERGETFGVAAVEAMAAGAAVVVSDLACFRDFVRPDQNALVFDHAAADAETRLADQAGRLLRDVGLRRQLAAAGRETARAYDFGHYAAALLDDFAALLPR